MSREMFTALGFPNLDTVDEFVAWRDEWPDERRLTISVELLEDICRRIKAIEERAE